jgi:hypothetical protein
MLAWTGDFEPEIERCEQGLNRAAGRNEVMDDKPAAPDDPREPVPSGVTMRPVPRRSSARC